MRWRWPVAGVLAASLLGACGLVAAERGAPPAVGQFGGDPAAGQALIVQYGCGACHRIPGVRGARSLVAPPLDSWAQRSYIAGVLLNSEENLVQWIRDPQEVNPGTAMPTLGLSEEEARAVAAYLFTLR